MDQLLSIAGRSQECHTCYDNWVAQVQQDVAVERSWKTLVKKNAQDENRY